MNKHYQDPLPPDEADLSRLERICLARKVVTILEFGTGWSTRRMAAALRVNRDRHGDAVARLRFCNAFELHAVDNVPHYLELSRQQVPEPLREHVRFHHSPVIMGEFAGRACTYYEQLPDICPDLIYLDGPSQNATEGALRGISTRPLDRLPMAADVLAMEHFLLPGTLIVVDGRTANARFLKANLQREWRHEHRVAEDIHLFEQVESPLFPLNREQIRFQLGNEWPGARICTGETTATDEQ